MIVGVLARYFPNNKCWQGRRLGVTVSSDGFHSSARTSDIPLGSLDFVTELPGAEVSVYEVGEDPVIHTDLE